MSATQAKGAAAEELAARHLAKHGLRVVERNFRVRGGEIDLICRDDSSVVFVEVRFRRRSEYGGAAASITAAKQARIIMAARHWLVRHGEQPCRFDCVLLDGEHIEWLRDAFAAD
jgi:putative endonuclease